MDLAPGQSLLQYRLVEKIGQGGMGVVWKATDSTLGREAAIKILPEGFAQDAERLARFDREARLLASLNHPNVASIYGIHAAEGVQFLAMELVPGEDLSQRLDRGRPPIAEALAIARDIARGLEAAHERGVIHRDLKPANVKLTADGKAKVLDFGLAKSADPEGTASGDPSASPTMTSAGTVAGLILGTASYMSPEQASGQPIDRRSDIWSFGVVLYELFSGDRLFDGETISHTMADVLRANIDLSELPDDVPRPVRRLLSRCLERDVRRRLRDIGEARIVLEDAVAGREDPEEVERAALVAAAAGAAAGGATAGGGGRSSWPWVLGIAAVAVLGMASLPWLLGGGATPEPPTQRFTLEMPSAGSVRQGDGSAIAISADGSTVVARGGSGNDDVLVVRRLDEFEVRPLMPSSGASAPEFSPDGEWVAFLSSASLQKVRLSGGAPVELANPPASAGNLGYHWGRDGFIYLPVGGNIMRVRDTGGELEQVNADGLPQDLALLEPFLLAESGIVLCNSSSRSSGSEQLHAIELATGAVVDLQMPGADPRWLPTGHVLFREGEEIRIARFDPAARKFLSQPFPVLERAAIDASSMHVAVSDNGTVVYLPRQEAQEQSVVYVDRDGRIQPVPLGSSPIPTANDPRLSPDGTQLVLSRGTADIWMFDLATRTPTLLTESGFYPLWSPDGREILFTSSRGKSFDLYRVPVDLSRPEELVLDVEHNMRTMDWPRMDRVVVREEIPGKGMDLMLWTDLSDPSAIEVFLDGPDDELAPEVSPDGKWIAYVSNYTGDDEVYVTSFPKAGARSRISNEGGHSPAWAPDGRTLYYVQDRKMIEVTLETSPAVRVLRREALFEGSYQQYRWSRQYDLTPDGKRFVMVRNAERKNLEVVTNWFAEIRDIGR